MVEKDCHHVPFVRILAHKILVIAEKPDHDLQTDPLSTNTLGFFFNNVPETNLVPENGWLEDDLLIWGQ